MNHCTHPQTQEEFKGLAARTVFPALFFCPIIVSLNCLGHLREKRREKGFMAVVYKRAWCLIFTLKKPKLGT